MGFVILLSNMDSELAGTESPRVAGADDSVMVPHGVVEIHFDIEQPLEDLERSWSLARRQMLRELTERGTP